MRTPVSGRRKPSKSKARAGRVCPGFNIYRPTGSSSLRSFSYFVATMASRTATSQLIAASTPPRPKRKKDERKDIWSSLLRQTREAQARSKTQAVQSRSLILCGGSPADQRAFVQGLARAPPPAPPARNRDQRPQKPKGEVRLSNQYAYGYGHVTLFSPPQQSTGMLSAECEEVARLELHTVPEPEQGYERTLRKLLEVHLDGDEEEDDLDNEGLTSGDKEHRRPAVAILLSWKEPWRFLDVLRRWLQLLARALVPADRPVLDPFDVLRGYELPITIVVQHVEAQEGLEREGYREESFDYISQCLRTCMLPLHSGLVYTSSSPPPQQPGSPLTEIQKVVYSALALDIAPLSPVPPKTSTPTKREDLVPQHNFVDRMAIVIPSGWDSAGKIRLISETFSPEAISDAWLADINTPVNPLKSSTDIKTAGEGKSDDAASPPANAAATSTDAEQTVFSTSAINSDDEDSDLPTSMSSPIKPSHSAITTYEQAVQDPNAHKALKPPMIEVTTKKSQDFLQDMRKHIQTLEAQDAERTKPATSTTSTGRLTGVPTGDQTGALDGLGDVSFNVGGVSYNTVSAEAAIEKLRQQPSINTSSHSIIDSSSSLVSSPRNNTPQPPRRRGGDRPAAETAGSAGAAETPTIPLNATSASIPTTTGKGTKGDRSSASAITTPATSGDVDFPSDKLEEYFASLMKRGGGGGGSSGSNTPSKPPPA